MPCNKLDTEQLLRTKGICKDKIKEKKNSITTVILKSIPSILFSNLCGLASRELKLHSHYSCEKYLDKLIAYIDTIYYC
jgi:hypothetical protein